MAKFRIQIQRVMFCVTKRNVIALNAEQSARHDFKFEDRLPEKVLNGLLEA